jgi:hypothetical protein
VVYFGMENTSLNLKLWQLIWSDLKWILLCEKPKV